MVDGPDHGVQVRHRKEPSSQCFAEPLPCGAVVEQMDLVDGALKFKRLSGIGPVSGWVSLRDADRDLLVKVATPSRHAKPTPGSAEASVEAAAPPSAARAGQRWVVVRSGDGPGLIVRQGRALSAPEVAQRLPVGAVVEQRELIGDRLHFALVSSSGPREGWVGVRHLGKDFLLPKHVVDAAEAEAREAAARLKEQQASRDDAQPLGGWAKLAAHYARPVAAAETGELPPIDELMSASVETVMEALGFSEDAAMEFVKMPRARKRRVIAESKALMEMPHERRQEALAKLRKAWPKGPFPTFSGEEAGPELLPEGCCFPLSRSYRDPETGIALDWDLDEETAKAARRAFPRKGYAPAAAQKDALAELRCEVVCRGADIEPEAAARIPDVCRLEGGGLNRDQLSGTIMAKGQVRPDDVAAFLNQEMRSRVCFMDGDVVARLQTERLSEADFRGERYKHFKEFDTSGRAVSLAGCYVLLSLSKPNLVIGLHKEYLLAGADIVRTNTMCGHPLALARYRMQKSAYDLNKAAAQLAKRATAEVTRQDKRRPRLVAGVLGPADSADCGWDRLVASYAEQVRGLVDGGVDLLSIEAGEALSAKAAVQAVAEHFEKAERKPPPMLISAACAAAPEGVARTPSGATVEAFCVSLRHAGALSLGAVCPPGGDAASSAAADADAEAPGWCHVCPGVAAEAAPEALAVALAEMCGGGDAPFNLVGGGAGTLPGHIAAAVRRCAAELRPRRLPAAEAIAARPMRLSGAEAATMPWDRGLAFVGQRCSPMGSARFKRLVDAFKATGDMRQLRRAVEVCASQCARGADVIELNLDSDSVDGTPLAGRGALGKFVRLVAQDPRIAGRPLMLGSCEWAVVEEGLREAPGRCIVNGICLMLGEEEFLRIAREAQRYGAALVVLAISEQGQAESYDDKVRVCQRSYRLLRSRLDFPPQDIIFDCQLMPLGSPEQAGQAADFINAVAELRRTCPGASFIGGLGNLSMRFRGMDSLRDALHSVFLHHAVPKGLNMALLEAGAVPRYEDLDAEIRTICEEMVLNRSADGDHLQRFLALASFRGNRSVCLPVSQRPWWESVSRSAEGAETQKGVLSKRKPSTAEEQRAYWASLRSSVTCSAAAVQPAPGASQPHPCSVRGTVRTEEILAKVLAKSALAPGEVLSYLNAELTSRVCVLGADPAAGLRQQGLPESDYRGSRFKDSRVPLKGNEDVLCLTQPELVARVHRESLLAGVDICFTNTLGACALGQEEYGLEACATEVSRAAAKIAKEAAADVAAKDRRPRLVAGVLGPTTATLSSGPRGEGDASLRTATWDEVVESYREQVRGLVEGGVDLLAVLSIRDTLNAKAAICAVSEFFERSGRERLPLILSAEVDEEGRLPSGQSLAAFLVSVRHAKPLAVGVECPGGRLRECLAALGSTACWSCALATGEGDAASALATCGRERLLNLVRVGASPAGAAAAAEAAKGATPRVLPRAVGGLQLCGLEVTAKSEEGVQIIGQRCSVGGSSSFRSLIAAYKYTKRGSSWDAAVQVCAQQIQAGAGLLDVNFDADEVDAKWAMGKFLRMCAADRAVAAVPCVISSASWPVIEEGLKNFQGKCVVNAISLAQGEQEFLRLARACLGYGAAIVVVAMEGEEPPASVEDRVRICQRGYRLLRSKLDFPAEDILLDCAVGPVGAPAEEGGAASSAADVLEAISEVKRTCPGASVVVGLSNLSTPLRGVPLLREAMHSVFLQHAARKGLSFAIADAGRLPRYTDLESPTLSLCEELLLNSSGDGGHARRFAEFAAFLRGAVADRGGPRAELVLPEQVLPLAVIPPPLRPSPSWRRPIETLVQATGTINASLFATFGSKAHAADTFHRITMAAGLKRNVLFSSVSAYMGQGGSGPVPGASSFLDGIAMWERHQGLNGQPITVQWGAIGEIGLRRAVYGSRDVFAQFDLGQKLIGPQDTQMLERAILTGSQVPEFLAMAYLDQTWQNTLAGVSASGGGLQGRATFADM